MGLDLDTSRPTNGCLWSLFKVFIKVCYNWKMRNALFVVVSLCVGFSFGFVIPTSVSELNQEDNSNLPQILNSKEISSSSIENITGLLVKHLTNQESNKKGINLEKLQSNIKDKALYDQGSPKESNIDERSFVFIDQRFKVPVLNHLHNLQLHNIQRHYGQNSYKTFISNLDHSGTLPFDDSNEEYEIPLKDYKEGMKDSRKSYYGPPAPLHQFFATNNKNPFKPKNLKIKGKIENIHFSEPQNDITISEPKGFLTKNDEINDVKMNDPEDEVVHQYHGVHLSEPILDELNDLKMKVQAANGIISNQYHTIAKDHDINDLKLNSDDMKFNLNDVNMISPKIPLVKEYSDLKMNPQAAKGALNPQYHIMDKNYKFNDMQYNFNGIKNIIPPIPTSNYKITDDHREYLELLKPPLLRPEGVKNINQKQSNDRFYPEEMEIKYNNIDVPKNYNNYGFVSPYTLHNSKFNDKPIGTNFESDRAYTFHDTDFNEKDKPIDAKYQNIDEHFRDEDFIDRAVDSKEDKILEGFIKNTLENGLIDKYNTRQNVHRNHCNAEEYSVTGKHNPKCNCGTPVKGSSNTGTNDKGKTTFPKERGLDFDLQDNTF